MQKILCAGSALALLSLSLCFTGCDPAYSLWIDNRSGRDRKITIIYNEQFAKSYGCQWADTYFMSYIAFSGNDTSHRQVRVMRKDSLSG